MTQEQFSSLQNEIISEVWYFNDIFQKVYPDPLAGLKLRANIPSYRRRSCSKIKEIRIRLFFKRNPDPDKVHPDPKPSF